MTTTKQKEKRVCSDCGSASTSFNKSRYIRKSDGKLSPPSEAWFRDGKGGWYCRYCYDKYHNPTTKRLKEQRLRRQLQIPDNCYIPEPEQPPTPEELRALDKCMNEEYCKLTRWQDQLDLGLFVCAECRSTACRCKSE